MLEVERIRELPYEDFVGWTLFFDERPEGWREDQRAYAIMSAFGVKEPAENIFSSLRQMKIAKEEAVEFRDGLTVVSSAPMGGFLQELGLAIGGDNIHADKD